MRERERASLWCWCPGRKGIRVGWWDAILKVNSGYSARSKRLALRPSAPSCCPRRIEERHASPKGTDRHCGRRVREEGDPAREIRQRRRREVSNPSADELRRIRKQEAPCGCRNFQTAPSEIVFDCSLSPLCPYDPRYRDILSSGTANS